MSNKTKWTPGPWKVRDSGGMLTIVADAGGGAFVSLGIPTPQRHVNARLIAAAPDLYEAAKDAEALLKSIEGQNALADELLRRVRAALALARGEQP